MLCTACVTVRVGSPCPGGAVGSHYCGPGLALHTPWGLVLRGRLQILLDAPVVLHLGGHGDGDRCTAPAAGERASPAVGANEGRGCHWSSTPHPTEGRLKANPCHSAPRDHPWDTPQEVGTEGSEASPLLLALEVPTGQPAGPGVPVALAPGGSHKPSTPWTAPFQHSPFSWATHRDGGSPALAWDPLLACPGPAYPEGLGELLHGGDGDGVRPWLSRPAEATSELLAETEQMGS